MTVLEQVPARRLANRDRAGAGSRRALRRRVGGAAGGAAALACADRRRPPGARDLRPPPARTPSQSIVDLVEAADWDEREAHDLYGLQFAGHEPLRALVRHTDDPGHWMTPVSGRGVHQVAVGPIHAGVIESGHFRFHAVGERILAMDPRLFYKHRGLERAAEGLSADQALAYIQRACAACAVSNTIAYAQAVEDARRAGAGS